MNLGFPGILFLYSLTTLAAGKAEAAEPVKRRPLAAVVVNSKKWKLVRTPHEIEEFSGDVYYRQGDRQVTADWARVDRTDGHWQARGDVRAALRRKNGDVLEVRGERAEHDEGSRNGRIVGEDGGGIRFAYFPAPPRPEGEPPPHAGPIVAEGAPRESGTARALEWNDAGSELRLEGDVEASGLDGRIRCEEALYRSEGSAVVLTGRRPVAARDDAKWNGAVQADRIATAQDRGRIDADGRVKGWLEFKNGNPYATERTERNRK